MYKTNNMYYDGIPSFLPIGINTDSLVDITRVGDCWRRFIDPNTGKVHDGAEYYKKYQEEMRKRSN